MGRGRPETWTPDKKEQAIEIIIDRICQGESTRSILLHANRDILPGMPLFLRWVEADEDLRNQYARAMEIRSEVLFDEILEISDEANADLDIGDDGKLRVIGEAVQRSKLKIEARKWALSKMQPKKYGDKIDHTSGGDKIENMAPIINIINPIND